MKSFCAALLCMTAYATQVEATTQLTTGATAEVEAAVQSIGGLGLGYGRRVGVYRGYATSDYSDSYSNSDYFSSDYSLSDYGYGYRRIGGIRRYMRYAPRYYNNRYYYGRRYASRLGAYTGIYRSYGYRSYGYGYRGLYNNLRRYGGHYYW